MLNTGENGRHAAIVRDLDIPSPFDLGEFAARLERRRGRPVHLCPFSSGPGAPCGLWIATAGADYVYYEQGTTPFHSTLIALHETAHLLLGLHGPDAWQDLARHMAPGTDPALVRLVLGRSAYATPESYFPGQTPLFSANGRSRCGRWETARLRRPAFDLSHGTARGVTSVTET